MCYFLMGFFPKLNLTIKLNIKTLFFKDTYGENKYPPPPPEKKKKRKEKRKRRYDDRCLTFRYAGKLLTNTQWIFE